MIDMQDFMQYLKELCTNNESGYLEIDITVDIYHCNCQKIWERE